MTEVLGNILSLSKCGLKKLLAEADEDRFKFFAKVLVWLLDLANIVPVSELYVLTYEYEYKENNV